MERFELTDTCTLSVQQGDITTSVSVDAIVNAANERMLGGGGVDGAIHRRAGPRLVEACREVPEVAPNVRCPCGEARITPGFGLPSEFVIHTVGPVYHASPQVASLLSAAYRSVLELANQRQLRTLAFPAISCGVYGYPIPEASAIALETCQAHAEDLSEIRFVLFDTDSYHLWLRAAVERFTPSS